MPSHSKIHDVFKFKRDSNNVNEHNLEQGQTSIYVDPESDDKTVQYQVVESLKNPLAVVIP
jgi:hypothetical protein